MSHPEKEVGVHRVSDIQVSVKTYGSFVKEIIHFNYMTYMATYHHKIPTPGVMKFTIFGKPSF